MSVSVLIVTFAAFITPMVLQRFKISVLPTAVAEVLVGIVLGKSGFDLVQTEGILSFLSNYGVIFLLFLSGMEIDFSIFKKNNGPLTPLARKKPPRRPRLHPFKSLLLPMGKLTNGTSLSLAL